ncbi:MAG: hypothetical protein R3D27_00650 [Hyphomicrobiaceae bacterium]
MATGATGSGDAQVVAPASSGGVRTHYESSGLRKSLLALLFLLLAPFAASLPIMIGQRLMKGIWLDMAGLLLLAAGFGLIMALLAVELVAALRSEVDIGERTVAFTLPDRVGGATALLSYTSREVAYSDIAAVEERCEVYGGRLAPVFMRGVRLVLHDGEKVPLGYVNDANVDPAFPFPEIGRAIARRAGVSVTDCGNVHRSVRAKMLGIVGAPDRIPSSEIDALNARHDRNMLVLAGLLAVLVLAGLAIDLLTASVDRGERARDAVTQAPAARGKGTR